jgi:hypothetical protein
MPKNNAQSSLWNQNLQNHEFEKVNEQSIESKVQLNFRGSLRKVRCNQLIEVSVLMPQRENKYFSSWVGLLRHPLKPTL